MQEASALRPPLLTHPILCCCDLSLLPIRAMHWMDRFEVPGSSPGVVEFAPSGTDGKLEDDVRIALVWDRGPAGDFVYGGLNDLPATEKRKRYEEFIAFDERVRLFCPERDDQPPCPRFRFKNSHLQHHRRGCLLRPSPPTSTQCRENDILFLKLLFVTNRDSIAKTLGKRLAQKKMAKDLTTWLRACSSRGGEEDVLFEGLEAISAHIDPTDFVAFNNYERNLQIFSNFALNTDTEENPWVVVNTGDRYVKHVVNSLGKTRNARSKTYMFITSLVRDLNIGMPPASHF